MDATLGQAIKDRRKDLKLSQAELGAQVGRRQATISDIERGEIPDVETLFALAQALRVVISLHPDGTGSVTPVEGAAKYPAS